MAAYSRIETVTTEASPRFTLRQRLVLAVVPRLVWALLWLVGRTWRFEVIAEEGATPLPFGEGAGAEIFCFWHQCVLPCTFYFRRTGATIIVSRSFDGELITRTLELFGFHTARGSSSRGAREGLLGLKQVIESGTSRHLYRRRPARPHLSHQDGPRQARAHHRRAHRRLSSAARARLDHAFLGSLPGAQALHAHRGQLGALDHVPADLAEDQFEQKREELNAAIERARLNALAHFGKADV